MRPMYESNEDRSREKSAVEIMSAHLNCDAVKLPIAYHVDFCLMRNRLITGLLEIKCRNKKYDQMFLSLNKFLHGVTMSSTLRVPFYLCYYFPGDSIYFADVSNKSIDVDFGLGGRADRNDWQDVELMAFFDLKRFTKIKIDN